MKLLDTRYIITIKPNGESGDTTSHSRYIILDIMYNMMLI